MLNSRSIPLNFWPSRRDILPEIYWYRSQINGSIIRIVLLWAPSRLKTATVSSESTFSNSAAHLPCQSNSLFLASSQTQWVWIFRSLDRLEGTARKRMIFANWYQYRWIAGDFQTDPAMVSTTSISKLLSEFDVRSYRWLYAWVHLSMVQKSFGCTTHLTVPLRQIYPLLVSSGLSTRDRHL